MAARRASQSNNQVAQRRDSHTQPINSLQDCKKKELPLGYADRILELEISLDSEFIAIDKVRELLELYMIGVEFYESVGDQRFIYFNKKMSSLMMKPNVIDAMAREKELKFGKAALEQKTKEDALREAEVRQREDTIRKTVNYSHQDNDEKAKAIVKNVQQEIQQNKKIISDSLDTQKKLLFERLQNRKARTLQKASSFTVLDLSITSDNDDSPQNGNTTTNSKIDFSLITHAIREDDQEYEHEDDYKKRLPRKMSIQEKIKKFKEELLNENKSPIHKETVSNRNSICINNKARSNSQASSLMQKRNSTFQRRVKDRKNSQIKQKRRVKSKSVEFKHENVEEDLSPIAIYQLEQWKDDINTCSKTLNQKVEPIQVNMNSIYEKTEEDEEFSPVRVLKRHN